MVEEAKQRRKKLKLTQQRLALLVGVSTPTISRFENGEKDIQWSSVLAILSMLGLTDQRSLKFSDPNPELRLSKGVVEFYGENEKGKTIYCSISVEALQDYFKSQEKEGFKIFKENQKQIEQLARSKYLYDKNSTNDVLITASDF